MESVIDVPARLSVTSPGASPQRRVGAHSSLICRRTNASPTGRCINLVVGALVIVVVVMGYQLYQDRKEPEGMRIDVGPKGLTIEKK